MTFNWGYGFSAKGGQSIKEKSDGSTVVNNKGTDLSLKIKVKGNDGESVSDILTKIAEEYDLDEASITITGTETNLKAALKDITEKIVKAGGQESLDEFFGQKQKEKIAA